MAGQRGALRLYFDLGFGDFGFGFGFEPAAFRVLVALDREADEALPPARVPPDFGAALADFVPPAFLELALPPLAALPVPALEAVPPFDPEAFVDAPLPAARRGELALLDVRLAGERLLRDDDAFDLLSGRGSASPTVRATSAALPTAFPATLPTVLVTSPTILPGFGM